MKDEQGKHIDVIISMEKELDKYGEVISLWCSVLDISEQVKTQKNLLKIQDYFNKVVENNIAGVLITDEADKVVYSNLAAAKLLNVEKSQLLGKHFGKPISAGETKFSIDILKPDRSIGKAEVIASQTLWENRPANLIMIHDITELEETKNQIERIAYFDHLTQLPNRLYFEEELNKTINYHSRRNFSFALFFIDLNDFKKVNDSLGHDVGDQLLYEAAQRMKNTLREEDTIARMGGDEFTIIVQSDNENEHLMTVANKLLEAFFIPIHIKKHKIYTIPSIGIAKFPDDAQSASDLLKLADIAMYKAKSHEPPNIEFYNRDMGINVHRDLSLDQSMHYAVENQEFELFYQPQKNLKTGKVVGFEALIRWHHPDEGIVAPDQFIPSLEKNGLIIKVGNWVIEQAIKQLKDWRGTPFAEMKIAINVSYLQFKQKDFVHNLLSTLFNYDIEPKQLIIEITENFLIHDTLSIMDKMMQLKHAGIEIHMDDFGTGFSSYKLLRELPFDMIKIDQSFIRNLDQDNHDFIIVESMIKTMHAIGKQVISEGVETETHQGILKGMGCDQIQGYLLSKPLPIKEVEELVLRLESSYT